MKKIALLLNVLIFAALVLASCSSPTGDDTATIILNFGEASIPDRAADSISVDQLLHKITLSGPTGNQTLTVSGGGTVSATVAAGLWHIRVDAYYGEELYAVGSAEAEVKAGKTTSVSIQMTVVWAGPNSGTSGGGGGGGGSRGNSGSTNAPSAEITVVLSQSTASIEQGQTKRFTATVTGTTNTVVTWSLTGGTLPTGVYSTGNIGDVYVDYSEIATTLFLTATSDADPGKSASAVISVLPTPAGSVPLSITVYPSLGGTLTPFTNERSTNFTVDVGGFTISDSDANNVTLSLIVPGFSFSGHNTPGNASGGIKTFTVTATYDGTTAFTGGTATISIIATDFPATYYLASPASTSIAINDGQSAGQPITVNSTNFADFNAYVRTSAGLSKQYILGSDITLVGNWTPIGGYPGGGDYSNVFSGTFDGDGYTISDLTITSSGSGGYGLFGYIAPGGVVKNLRLDNVDINIPGSNQFVGAIAGGNADGTVENCYVEGTVQGYDQVGAIVGRNLGTVQNCYSEGSVIGNDAVGGIVGMNDEADTVKNCYSLATVSGNTLVGGIVGSYYRGKIENCVALNPSVTASTSDGGRISGGTSPGSIATFTGNYAKTGMIVTVGASPSTPSGTTSDINGANVSSGAGGYDGDTWWTGTAGWTVNATKAAASVSSPWVWYNGTPSVPGLTVDRPALWFLLP